MELIDNIFDKGRLIGIPTGFPTLDAIIGGLRSRTLVVLAGATGMGKSLLGIGILVNMAKRGIKVSYYDLENGPEQSFERVMRIWYGLPQEFFLDESNKARAEDMYNEIIKNFEYKSHDALYQLADYSGESVTWVLNKLIIGDKSPVVMIDPLQALEENGKTDVFEQQGEIVKRTKEVAQTHNKTVILCHHIRKSSSSSGQWIEDVAEAQKTKYRIPTLDDLRGSGKISDFATDVWGITRAISADTAEGRGKTFFKVLKSRSGFIGQTTDLFLDETTLAFKDRSVSEDPEKLMKMFADTNFIS